MLAVSVKAGCNNNASNASFMLAYIETGNTGVPGNFWNTSAKSFSLRLCAFAINK